MAGETQTTTQQTTTPPPAENAAQGTTSPTQTALGAQQPTNNDGSQTTKQGGEAKAQETTAAELDLKLPEGVVVDSGLMEKFKPIAKEFGLDTPKAQKLVDLYSEAVQTVSTKATEAHQKQVQDWLTASKTDKQYGGPEFDKNLAAAQKAVEKFGGQELKDFFNQTGIGNHPALFRAFAQIGRKISEDTVATTVAPPAPPAPTEQEMLARRYPSMYNPDGSLK